MALLGLFGVALAWRLGLLAIYSHHDLFGHLNADSAVYWDWASLLREHGLMGRAPFFLGPLYPYWLVLVRTLAGDSILQVLRVQVVLGAVGAVLIADAARRLVSSRVAFVVGLAFALNRMTVFFDQQILMESLLVTLGCLYLWLMIALPWRRRPLLCSCIIGALIGLMALGRPLFLILGIPTIVHASRLLKGRALARAAVCLAAAIVAPALPVAARHFNLFHELVPYTYSFGYNLHVGNGPLANGTYVIPTGAYEPRSLEGFGQEGGTAGDGRSFISDTEGRELGPLESSRHWAGRTTAFVREHIPQTIGLYAKKLGFLLNRSELPQIESAAAFERSVAPLGPPLVGGFALIGMLGILGAMVAGGRYPRGAVVVWTVATMALAIAVFFVTDRYRVHLLPPLAILSAVAIERVRDAARARDRRSWMKLGALACVGAGLVCLPLIPDDQKRTQYDALASAGDARLADGDALGAIRAYQAAVLLDKPGQLRGRTTPSAVIARASVLENLGTAQMIAGEYRAASRSLGKALALAPQTLSLRFKLAEALAVLGEPRSAVEELRGVGADSAQIVQFFLNSAKRANAAHRDSITASLLVAAAEVGPGTVEVVVPLLRALIPAGRMAEAEARLWRAEAEGVDPAVCRVFRAWVAATRGRLSSARAILSAITPEQRRKPVVQSQIAYLGEAYPSVAP